MQIFNTNFFQEKLFKSILCLNGDLPPVDFFNNNLPIFAADGAANKLMQLGIMPELVIGDLDSVTAENLTKLNTHYHYDQNFCDFEKSLQYLTKQNLLPTIVVGINGGYLDHVLNNINCFVQTNSIFYAPPMVGFVLRQGEEKILTLPLNSKISLIGVPDAIVSTVGLQWELLNYHLSFIGKNSCFNRSVKDNVEIKVHYGNVLVMVLLGN